MQTLECSLPLPSDLECDRCIVRLQSELGKIQGVLDATVQRQRTAIQIIYDPSILKSEGLEIECRKLGSAIVARIDHQTIDLYDLHCSDCATTIQNRTSGLPGVLWAEVLFAAGRLTVEFDRSQTSLEKICAVVNAHGVRACPTRPAASKNAVPTAHGMGNTRQKEKEIGVSLALITAALLLQAFHPPVLSAWLYGAALLIGGRQIVRTSWAALQGRSIDMNVLVTVAVVGAIGIGEWFEGAVVVLLFNAGNLLQSRAVEHTRRSIRSLMDLNPKTVHVRRQEIEVVVPVEQVALHEIILVKPGERIPMDGEIVAGATSVNEAPITGESLPAYKQLGDMVFGGTLNGVGAIELCVTHRYQDTLLSRIVHWVEEAQEQRAPVQQFIDRFASRYTPIVVGLALCVALLPPTGHLLWELVHHLPLHYAVFAPWLARALAMLLIACPCALVISTPVAMVTAIGSASRKGVLIKGGAYLERVAGLKVMLYDKTGTLTLGHCRIEEIIPLDTRSEQDLLEIARILESKSEHPLAVAFLHAAHPSCMLREGEAIDFRAIPGAGVCGKVDGQTYLLGNAGLMCQQQIPMEGVEAALERAEHSGKTVVILATTARPVGLFVIADVPRPEAGATVGALERMGIQHQAILTGDNPYAAQSVAAAVGISDVHSRLRPDDKLRLVQTYRAQYGSVGMLGDGINDAPALAAADIGIVLGAVGNETAMETADIALMSDNLNHLPYLIRLSRRTRNIIRQNVVFSLLTKGLLLITAMVSGVPLWLAVLGDVGVSLIVTLNALRLREREEG
jgi:Cd2+/Zn2+-exporting ATPase